MKGRAWLEGQRPQPQAELATSMACDLDDGSAEEGDRGVDYAFLGELASKRLAEARARPGRVRSAAFDLLVADAWLTYASAAALDSDDPVAALEALMEIGRP